MAVTTWSGVLKLLLYWIFLRTVTTESQAPHAAAWRWSCQSGNCKKTELLAGAGDQKTALSLPACKMFCTNHGTLWPLPTGDISLGTKLIRINKEKISYKIMNHGKSDDILEGVIERFKEKFAKTAPEGAPVHPLGKSLSIHLVHQDVDVTMLELTTKEGYILETQAMKDGNMNATVVAENVFGLRHGLETLLQLFIYDDIRSEIQMVKNTRITDAPVYPYRGILLDTSRNYYSVDSIKRTIDAMAAVKLNTFHWHITDSQSFPFVSERRPGLSKYGAISPAKVYTKDAIRDIVKFARVRGVRVMPEFDAPAHVGEGWQHSNMTACFNAQPWRTYCVEPPCGQLDPSNPDLYPVLEDIYKDMFEAFEPDMFHMGGDEVSETCWNSSQRIQEFMIQNRWDLRKASFLKLWDYFQGRAKEAVYKANNNKHIPIVLWTSTLTEFSTVESYLDKNDYIIQVWTSATDSQIKGLLKKDYKLIMSNYDALYLDCGFAAWVGAGNNWCSPYIGWQKIYNNSPADIAQDYKNNILGGEAALWSEQSDSSSLDNRLWPRAAALAERLWTEPEQDWRSAEQRMLHVRERLVKLGIQADSIEPEWCYQNEGQCNG